MNHTFYTIQFACDLCGLPVGSAVVSSEFGWTPDTATAYIYREKHGLVDQRCAACEQLHGSFRDMCHEHISRTGEGWPAAEAFTRKNKKRHDFDRELKKKLEVQEDHENSTEDIIIV